MHFGLGIHVGIYKLKGKVNAFYRKNFLKKSIRTIYFYPREPGIAEVIFKIAIKNGYRFVKDPAKADIKVHWEDTTFPKAKTDPDFINSGCKSVSKKDVTKIFEEVFKLSLAVDPTKFKGNCVKKSDFNAKHDGVVLECPVKTIEPGCIYQRLINNSLNDELVEDIRIPYIGGEVPFVYLKYRKLPDRFSNINSFVKLEEVENVIDPDELSGIKEVCSRLDLDYCEVDAVRDYPEGTLYIVDVNHCPSGPPNHLSGRNSSKALKLMSELFDAQFSNL